MNETSVHSGGEVVFFEFSDGDVHLDVYLEHEAIGLTQAQMAELLGRDQSVISRRVQRALADARTSRRPIAMCRKCTSLPTSP